MRLSLLSMYVWAWRCMRDTTVWLHEEQWLNGNLLAMTNMTRNTGVERKGTTKTGDDAQKRGEAVGRREDQFSSISSSPTLIGKPEPSPDPVHTNLLGQAALMLSFSFGHPKVEGYSEVSN